MSAALSRNLSGTAATDAAIGNNLPMAKFGKALGRRAGPWGTALVLWDVWKRIPPKHRKRILQQARKHGPRLAKQAIKARRNRGA